MEKDARVYVAGHRGLVGSALVGALRTQGYTQLIYRTSQELDLRDQAAVKGLYAVEIPQYVIVAAANVGGILANDHYPVDFLYDNLMIEANEHADVEAPRKMKDAARETVQRGRSSVWRLDPDC